jgi:hypothetical protein
MVVYVDWKTVIYIYVCGKCRTQCMLPIEKLVTFTGACANEIIPSINRSFVATFSANVNINYRLPINVYYHMCPLRHIRIEINHGNQNVF